MKGDDPLKTPELDARGRRLRAALAAMLVCDDAPELVPEWLDYWSGIELIIAGMTHLGWDVELTADAARDWRANFFPVGIAHAVVGGSACKPMPWRRCSGRRGPTTAAGRAARPSLGGL
jgi:hypothetical protein